MKSSTEKQIARSPITATLALGASFTTSSLEIFSDTVSIAFILISSALLIYSLRLLGRHSHVNDWILGKEPRKSKLQILGEHLSTSLARVPVPPYLDDLMIIVFPVQNMPLEVDVQFQNRTPYGIANIYINSMNTMSFLHPGVASMDQWNHCTESDREKFSELSRPIEIPSLAAGATCIVRRRLFPKVLPCSITVNVKLLHEIEQNSEQKHYYVKAVVHSKFSTHAQCQT